jgi:autophagy-related protein 18
MAFYLLSGGEGVRVIERLFSSSLIAVVGVSSPCKLRLWHLKKGTEISSYVYPGIIMALRLSQQVDKAD